ncbi:Co2+/Mg2+ efflux protein ApaG [Caldimonas sp. KR1-144]|uniref:Co2+/Mg2+ efflux protein ApaG n=1 Tax=Caldimonas sp. KR1-144 TaxID=3400911 RepID=UPI003C0FD4F1
MSRCELQCSVRVAPLPEQSDPDEGVHAWAYTIRIENRGDIAAQVVARRWLIEDENGRREEVRGLGIVGRQPLLQPGESHEYTSWVQLRTPRGTMQGTYLCMSAEAEPFEAPIPMFQLGEPPMLH